MRTPYLIAVIFFLSVWKPLAFATSLAEVVSKLEEIDQMRESLAGSLSSAPQEITEATFQAVCVPVGKFLKAWAEAGGHKARQISHKPRNKQNMAGGRDLAVVREFQKNPARQYLIEQRIEGAVPGFQVYRRINVTATCLHCHGEKNSRPDFIKAKYPGDLAFGFSKGDLRGLYSVWIEQTKK